MSELMNLPKAEVQTIDNQSGFQVPEQIKLEILDDRIRRKYLTRLTEMEIAPVTDLPSLEDDLIDNVRMYHITEMVYQKGEPALDKFTTVFNTIAAYDATVFIVLDSDGKKTDLYFGVRNDEKDLEKKRSTVTLGDTLKNAMVGHFPGIKIENKDRGEIAQLCKRISQQHNLSAVSVAGNVKNKKEQSNEQFIQGLEKLLLSMQGRQYIGLIIADKKMSTDIEKIRHEYQNEFSILSSFQKTQISGSETLGSSRSKSFAEMNGKQKAAMIGAALAPIGGLAIGKGLALGAAGAVAAVEAVQAAATGAPGNGIGAIGMMIGAQAGGQIGNLISSIAPVENLSKSDTKSISTTFENKAVTNMLERIDDILKHTDEYDSYGLWNVAGYFLSDDMSAAEIAAGNYRSLMNGDGSGKEVSAINSWSKKEQEQENGYDKLTEALSRFIHPTFFYGYTGDFNNLVSAATYISGKELGLHIGLPRATAPGFPVIEHAEFGKEVYTYQLVDKGKKSRPEDRMTLGHVFDLGQKTNKIVELDNESLNMHTFITGSTGSGKSNTVYQMLSELLQDQIPFLVIEPAKGEYKDRFGNLQNVNVYSTNPNVAELLNINPFRFPKSIHVLEHVDGLVEIFSVCWPMYDAMPAFFKDAILRSYEAVGWDLGSSSFEGRKRQEPEYPDFSILAEQLDHLIGASEYASDIKSNYRGALLTRVRSLTVGLNKFIFTTEQTPYEKLFDENCILDISRVKSSETKALLMGLMVYILNEYRADRKCGSNHSLRHVTVLEEAHNLLKNTEGTGESALIGKSVEMITQTIAEIRTYGEGFIIVDQSPSSVDIAAIKNTNTKIVLRTPEANDREAVGRSMGLTSDQVNEIAKLPKGVAVVYQNDWVNPVLTLIDKAQVKENTYIPRHRTRIRKASSARTTLLRMLMQFRFNTKQETMTDLKESLKVLNLSRQDRTELNAIIERYVMTGGRYDWKEEEMAKLQHLVSAVLDIRLQYLYQLTSPDQLEELVREKTRDLKLKEVRETCLVLTLPGGGTEDAIG